MQHPSTKTTPQKVRKYPAKIRKYAQKYANQDFFPGGMLRETAEGQTGNLLASMVHGRYGDLLPKPKSNNSPPFSRF